jgi:hypothetical protein
MSPRILTVQPSRREDTMTGQRLVKTVALAGILLLLLGGGLAKAQRSEPGSAELSAAISTGFTYQGQIIKDGMPANGTCDVRFALFDAATSGSQVGAHVERLAVTVTGGLFTVPDLDFGTSAFLGQARWLQVEVRCPPDADYTIAGDRQLLHATPYALYSTGNWGLAGNGGTTAGTHYLGTSDDQPFEVRVNGQRALRIEPDAYDMSPLLVGGSSGNTVNPAFSGGTIGGGGYAASECGPTGDAPCWNRVENWFGTISGGVGHLASGSSSTVAGGADNTASGWGAAVGGGEFNTASGLLTAIPGGVFNTAGGAYSFAAGRRAQANHQGSFVWGDSTDADFASEADDQFLVRATGGVNFDTGGAPFQVNGHTLPVNLPPVAVLQAAPALVFLGETGTETVVLSMTLSYDPEGGGLDYAFDPTGRTLGAPADWDSPPTSSAVYDTTGNYLAAGWARDSGGAVDRSQARVSIYRFRNDVVDTSGRAGADASLAMVNGRFSIAYVEQNSADLRFVRAEDVSATSWGAPVIVESLNAAVHPSLAVVEGRPAIALYRPSTTGVSYVRANDATGSSWADIVSVDHDDEVGSHPSLAVVDGRPAIAYPDGAPNYDLNYMRADDATGASWPMVPEVVDSDGLVGSHPSLAIVDGRPAIAYLAYDYGNGQLKYALSQDAIGAVWLTPRVVAPASYNADPHASLVVVDGHPAIAYRWGAEVRYVRSDDATGYSWPTPTVVATAAVRAEYTSLAVVAGRPAIAYRDVGDYDLKYVQANDAAGASWGTPITVHGTEEAGEYASLAALETLPAIAYYEQINDDLWFSMPRQD